MAAFSWDVRVTQGPLKTSAVIHLHFLWLVAERSALHSLLGPSFPPPSGDQPPTHITPQRACDEQWSAFRSLWPPGDLAGAVGLDGLPPLPASVQTELFLRKMSFKWLLAASEHGNDFLMVFCSDAAWKSVSSSSIN